MAFDADRHPRNRLPPRNLRPLLPEARSVLNATGAPACQRPSDSGVRPFLCGRIPSALGQPLRQIGVEAQGIADAVARERRAGRLSARVIARMRGRVAAPPRGMGHVLTKSPLRLPGPMPSRPKFTGFCRNNRGLGRERFAEQDSH